MCAGAVAVRLAGTAASVTTQPRAWHRLVRNPSAVAGAIALLLISVAAMTAPRVAPHDPARQSLMRRYTPPAWLSSIIVLATLQVAQAILAEAALSFLGVGPGTSTRCGDR